MSGLPLLELLIRTGSIWLPIAHRAPRDVATFVASATRPATAAPVDLTQGWTRALPILIVPPDFLHALFLLRNVRSASGLSTDGGPIPPRG